MKLLTILRLCRIFGRIKNLLSSGTPRVPWKMLRIFGLIKTLLSSGTPRVPWKMLRIFGLIKTLLSSRLKIFSLIPILVLLFLSSCSSDNEPVISFEATPDSISIHWKDKSDQPYLQLEQLRLGLESADKQVLMLTNGGIYEPGEIPTGLHIENRQTKIPLNTDDKAGNFYAQPNGVFYINESEANILATKQYETLNFLPEYATQSGPLLIQNNEITDTANQSQGAKFTRNGVGILKNGNVLFLYSSKKITIKEFAELFKTYGVADALYLDGFVSRLEIITDGNAINPHTDFAAMIAVTEN